MRKLQNQHMKNKILRQGMRVSIEDLEKLIKEMKMEQMQTRKSLGLSSRVNKKQGWIIPIINKELKCSDTWTLEE